MAAGLLHHQVQTLLTTLRRRVSRLPLSRRRSLLVLSHRGHLDNSQSHSTWHQSKIFGVFPGWREHLDITAEAHKVENPPVQAEGQEKDSDDGIIDLHQDDLANDHPLGEDISNSNAITKKSWVLELETDVVTLEILLAYAYNKRQLFDLTQYPQKVRENVWELAAKYKCECLMLYAESSIL